MDWWHKMVFPVRRVWFAVSARVKARKNGAGLLKLRDDIQTCGYEDVQVMWEMLRRSDSELISNHTSKRKQRPFWRVFVWPNPSTAPSFSAPHT
ncbi:MAGUK p55 subfamily member 4 like [Actinidia chinensis var. chinensis]|uniref:MAGUK p55 subfamily member 4 like n=1 Tax=Actinidia chinensis var. chinensis TaxID=1590841 RepID=A0A2R6PV22_ACTCC|nr:MAGUK p55 subfamily member 4 like [Actinidia chinensis var. chinensis]